MPLVAFLRGVNVGGHKAFQPSVLARELAEFDVVNIGAAGTFVVRKKVSQTALRAVLLQKLPVQAEIMICRGREVLDLEAAQPFRDCPADNDVKRYVSVLAKKAAAAPAFPFCKPGGAEWQVQIIGLIGRFALSLHRRQGRTLIYANEVVEKNLGVSATTRNWNTISAICEALKGA